VNLICDESAGTKFPLEMPAADKQIPWRGFVTYFGNESCEGRENSEVWQKIKLKHE